MSFLLISLNCLLVLLSILSVNQDHGSSKGFLGSIMLLQGSVNGVFLAGDLISLFIFFEALLIPMYFLMGIWGGEIKGMQQLNLSYIRFLALFLYWPEQYTRVF